MEFAENDLLLSIDPSGIDISGSGRIIMDSSGNMSVSGVITGTTAATNTNDTTIATTAYVKANIPTSVTALSDVTNAGSGAIITNAERTKLTGIETSADVTDATNVEAAGAVMKSGTQTIPGAKNFTGDASFNDVSMNHADIDEIRLTGLDSSTHNQKVLMINSSGVIDVCTNLVSGGGTTITGAATTIETDNLTVSRALVSNGSGKVAVSATTSTEIGYLDGVSSNVQTQLNTITSGYVSLAGNQTITGSKNFTGDASFNDVSMNHADIDEIRLTGLDSSTHNQKVLMINSSGVIDVCTNLVSGGGTTITGAATTIETDNLTVSRALVSNGSGKVAVSDTTSTEIGYLDGVSSNVQTQLNTITSGYVSLAGNQTITGAKNFSGDASFNDVSMNHADIDEIRLTGLDSSTHNQKVLMINSSGVIDVCTNLVSGGGTTITGAATTIETDNLTVSRALVSNGSGKVAVSDTTSTEIGYLDGVSSNVQTQLNTITSGYVSLAGNQTIPGAKNFTGDASFNDVSMNHADIDEIRLTGLDSSTHNQKVLMINSSGVIDVCTNLVSGGGTTITGAATTIETDNLTVSRALVSNGSGKVAVSATTSTEIGYLDGVSSNVQTQLNTITSGYVSLAGNQTITGAKNFTGDASFNDVSMNHADIDEIRLTGINSSTHNQKVLMINSSGVIDVCTNLVSGGGTTITGAATTIETDNLTVSRALVSNGSGKVAVSATTSTEIGYLDGVSSNVQTQLNTITSGYVSLAGNQTITGDKNFTGDASFNDVSMNHADIDEIRLTGINSSTHNQKVLMINSSGVIDVCTNLVSGGGTTITGAATTIETDNLTVSRALVSNGSGKVAVSATTSTEIGYLDGVSSNVQTQLNTITSGYVSLAGNQTITGAKNFTGDASFNDVSMNHADIDEIRLTGINSSTHNQKVLMINSSGVIDVCTNLVSGGGTTITGAATTIETDNLTVSRALVSNGSGKVAVSDTTSTEIGYLDGVSSNVQTQLNTITSGYVSLAGNQTITGAKNFTGDASFNDVSMNHADIDEIRLTGLDSSTHNQKVLMINSSGVIDVCTNLVSGGGGGSSTFTGLSDTPANYNESSGKYLKVDGTNIVFDTPTGNGDAVLASNQTFSGNNVFTGDTSMADVSVNVLEIGGRLFPSGGSDGQVLKLSSGNLTWAADGGGSGGSSLWSVSGDWITPNSSNASKGVKITGSVSVTPNSTDPDIIFLTSYENAWASSPQTEPAIDQWYAAWNDDTGNLSSSSSVNFSLWADHSIKALRLYQPSDIRIKRDISMVDDNEALTIVNNIETMKYNYKDIRNMRQTKTYGFLAQNVREHLSNAVSLQTEYIPDITKHCYDCSWNQTESGNWKLTLAEPIDISSNMTGNVKLFAYNISDISNSTLDENSITELNIKIEDDKQSFILNKKHEHIFIFGREINDFHFLDKDQIFAVHHSAIQELSRKNDTLTQEVATLKTENADYKARLEALEEAFILFQQGQ